MEMQVLFSFLGIQVTGTVVTTWVLMLLLTILALVLTRSLTIGVPGPRQNIAELVVEGLFSFVEETLGPEGEGYFPFIATLGLFVLIANLMAMIPWVSPPTADLSTTLALALMVFLVSHGTGIRKQGLGNYLRGYLSPHLLLLPLNLVGEVGKVLSHGFRLYGNMVGGGILISVAYMIAPWLVPVPLMGWFSVFMGIIQAVVFTMLAAVYIQLYF